MATQIQEHQPNELKQTRVYQEALEEGLEQGRQEGELAVVMRHTHVATWYS
ncbi:MAG TPA: hypothetical protein V6D09_16310 [Leptolyngbyaceae cyanobacterium]